MSNRKVIEQIVARATSDGDGVKLSRVFGGDRPERFDPFLMLDEFGSDEASDYIGGFPSHPHRGFQTVTYMLEGKMEHRDHLGNVGLLTDGGVQWMSAGRGVIHSEMPKQTEGRMRGFQLWVNLPCDKKMTPAWYQDVPAADLPEYNVTGARIKAIAGRSKLKVAQSEHSIEGLKSASESHVLYLDIALDPATELTVKTDYSTCMIYGYEGSGSLGDANTPLKSQVLSRLSENGDVVIKSGKDGMRILVIAGQPINEPIVQHGPFVMNTIEEIEQAIKDFQQGSLTN